MQEQSLLQQIQIQILFDTRDTVKPVLCDRVSVYTADTVDHVSVYTAVTVDGRWLNLFTDLPQV